MLTNWYYPKRNMSSEMSEASTNPQSNLPLATNPPPMATGFSPPLGSPDVTMESPEIVQKTREDLIKVFRTAGVKMDKVASWAVKRRRRDILKLLIKSNVDLDKSDNRGYTPLGLAVLAGDKKTVHILTEAGASVDLQDDFGNTPMKYAALTHHRSIAQLLRRHVVKLNSKDDDEISSPESL